MASAVYELLLLFAVVIVVSFPFLAVLGESTEGWRRHALQAWYVVACGGYFGLFWTRSGQTLPMKVWRLRVIRQDGARVSWPRAMHRYLLSLLGLAAGGLGFLWALWDPHGQFLHDRLAGTAIVDVPAAAREKPA
jgi:uncharacterized RDD family membrane protein YckC